MTISTVGGSAEGIRRLAEVVPLCRLALSLHSADQTLREELIPAAKKVPLPQLGEALDYHAQQAGCGAMLEYLLIQGKVRGVVWGVTKHSLPHQTPKPDVPYTCTDAPYPIHDALSTHLPLLRMTAWRMRTVWPSFAWRGRRPHQRANPPTST